MLDALYEFSHYAPLVIFVASILDIFFISGYIFYGFAMATTVAVMHAGGMISTEMLVVSALAGTIIGNSTNFMAGRLFSQSGFVQRRLANVHIEKARNVLQHKGLFVFMAICRSVTFLRPAYALLLGTIKTPAKKFFLFEVIIASCWIAFWTTVIISGETIVSSFFAK